ncbi:c-type cytochrome biogenesis protein CcsB [Brachybacterium phenoliresistens]
MNEQLAEVSNLLIVVAIVVYILGLIGFSADLAAASQRRSDQRLAQKQLVGAASAAVPEAGGGVFPSAGAGDGGGAPAPRTMSALTFAYGMTGVAVLLHLAGIVLRGVVTQRVPWANMYEFSMSGAAVVVLMFLIFSIRRGDLRLLGTFVILPVLIVMLVAQTFWIVPAATLTPSLQNSHWLVIHVIIAVLSSGLFGLGALVAVLQLIQSRYEAARAGLGAAGASDAPAAQAEGQDAGAGAPVWGRVGSVLDRLPGAKPLEALSYRIHAVAFVGWTFTLIFGAIWANQAWGRFWNWDPKEVWTFITWVVYACYLHARATRGFRGNKAAWFALAGFVCVIFNYTVVNTVINGLHSYSGL